MERKFKTLEVTEVIVKPFTQNVGRIKGIATITLNDQLRLRDLRIIDGAHGLFVGYPSDPFYKGEDFVTIYNPITRKLREHIEEVVISEYHKAVFEKGV